MTSPFNCKFKVTSIRGKRTLNGMAEYHGGLDLVSLGDKTVYAVADGKVDAVPYEANGFGYYVRQVLADGRRIYYGHMQANSIPVKAGANIKKGDKVGIMGSTGKSTGAHLHLEIRPKGTSKESLDICAFTGIPNKVGTYEATKKNKYSYDDTVENMILDGVTNVANMQNWERFLAGSEPMKAEYVRTILNRYHEAIKNGK